MATGKIKFFPEGLQAILCSPGADELCRSYAQIWANSANAAYGGDGFVAHGEIAHMYKLDRAEWWVKSTDRASAKAEAENKVLTGAIR
jgi:hypothetical protein